MKVTIFAATRYHVPKLVKFVVSHGIAQEGITRLSDSFSFQADGEKASFLLTEMKHKFPIAYSQGWSENEN
jgi:hypothetical protein